MTAASAGADLVQVALPVPLRQLFDYRVPAGTMVPEPGCRVRVPFGRRTLTGVVLARTARSDLPPERLKNLAAIVDRQPLLAPADLAMLTWIADYYLHPVGEVCAAALPVLLRGDKPPREAEDRRWHLTTAGRERLAAGAGRAPLQFRLLAALAENDAGLDAAALRLLSPRWRTALDALVRDDCVAMAPLPEAYRGLREDPPAATPGQAEAIAAIGQSHGFRCHLVHGITGSGKTEIYLRCIERVLAQGRQCLVLVPEIALTPQLESRFRNRFDAVIDVLHSGLTETQRLQAWQRAAGGRSAVVIGTRSAVFVPLARPGLVILDEEHDPSYKQQEGFRYHARDVAIKRASLAGIPVVLGSATPSLESYHNALQGRFQLTQLHERPTRAGLPAVHLLDLAHLPVEHGISRPLRDAIGACRARGEQSLLFLNRRGFAPAIYCPACGWLAHCPRCDARLTWHRAADRLRCHHCGHVGSRPRQCPQCGEPEVISLGQGTENIHDTLQQLFPGAVIERIDRDTTRRRGELEQRLTRVHAGEAEILVGTQMLSKGHDFPGVTLVGIVDCDQLLFSADFRASERLFQLVTQVAGRCGRAERPGTVLIQTRFPQSPWLQPVIRHDYAAFADMALAERQAADYPPYTHLALLRAEAAGRNVALAFLEAMHRLAQELAVTTPSVEVMEPLPSLMEKRAGRYRAQLLVQSRQRAPLHQFLARWRGAIEASRRSRTVRWSLDVDPVDLY